ncbi:hypothetical protein KP003_14430 [Geomonas nitrogeniifigens]|uniref:hypothetical protein n=1 Tax=Geomonas diazotrophica TaxID=2843197 RepID=UPI001C2C5C44|nr:hypothetical protein [Geomonas nitrogeniifigens]QXE85574.1 hypothetical protein KP003_14430 [Geomonas nitrogeniifigens]
MSAAQQKQLPLQPKEYENYHDPTKFGFFSLLSRNDAGNTQRSYPLPLLHEVPTLIDPRRDTYISQAEFNKPNRRIVNLARIGLLFVDLDYYHHAELKHLTPQQVASQIIDFCNFEGIPEPSAIVSSGRGLYLKWFLTKAVPAQALPRWNCTMTILVTRFSGFSADPRAKDASRVLRLESTINEKTGKLVRVIHYSGQSYDFEDLARELLPVSREECREHRKNQIEQAHLKLIQGNGNKTGLQKLSPIQLNWDRLRDLRNLAELRGGVEPGSRDTFLFLATCFMSWVVSDIYHEVEELCRQFCTWSNPSRGPQLHINCPQ